jgi:hypothetical protein
MLPIGNIKAAIPISYVLPAFPKIEPVPIHVASIVPTKIHEVRDLPASAKSDWEFILRDLMIPIPISIKR